CYLLGSRLSHGTRADARNIVSAVDKRGCLFIYSGLSALYRLADTCIATKYAFPSHLSRQRESGAIGTDPVQEVEHAMQSRPATVIVRSPFDGENWPARAVVLRHLRQDYHLVLEQKLGWHSV